MHEKYTAEYWEDVIDDFKNQKVIVEKRFQDFDKFARRCNPDGPSDPRDFEEDWGEFAMPLKNALEALEAKANKYLDRLGPFIEEAALCERAQAPITREPYCAQYCRLRGQYETAIAEADRLIAWVDGEIERLKSG